MQGGRSCVLQQGCDYIIKFVTHQRLPGNCPGARPRLTRALAAERAKPMAQELLQIAAGRTGFPANNAALTSVVSALPPIVWEADYFEPMNTWKEFNSNGYHRHYVDFKDENAFIDAIHIRRHVDQSGRLLQQYADVHWAGNLFHFQNSSDRDGWPQIFSLFGNMMNTNPDGTPNYDSPKPNRVVDLIVSMQDSSGPYQRRFRFRIRTVIVQIRPGANDPSTFRIIPIAAAKEMQAALAAEA